MRTPRRVAVARGGDEDADLGMESARAAGYKRVVDVRLMSEYHLTDYLCREE